MFDIGFTELLLIGVVALIVVGPKDLPGMFRTLGRFTTRARQMAREFTTAMHDAADETGAKDIANTIKGATNPKAMGLDALNKAADGFEKWDPSKALRDQKEADAETKAPELSEERAAVAEKIHAATAKAATDAKAEAAKAAEQEAAPKAAPAKKASVKKAPAKKAPAKKAPAKKAPAKKPATKTAAKTAAKKTSKKTDTPDA